MFQTIDVENLETLYGKHEKLLNDLLVRFDLGMINDFYSYFRQPWVYAIYHDRFKLLQESNYELLKNEKSLDKNERILDLVVGALKACNWQRVRFNISAYNEHRTDRFSNRFLRLNENFFFQPSPEKLNEIKAKFHQSKVKKQIIDNVLEFLYYHDEPFPMYATPKILRVLLQDATTSLLHKVIQHETTAKSVIKISDMVRRF